jgi:tetratricopeptide (TPR) repeat protein
MKKFCDGHPTRKAHWHCSECGTLLCPECVVERESESYGHTQTDHFCPKCNRPVGWVGVQNFIGPFWNRMPRIFSYPVATQPLVLMFVLAVATLFVSGPGFISAALKGAMWLIVIKYSFEALKATARGDLKPPAITAKTISEDFQQVFKQFGIYFAIFIAFGWISATAGILAGFAFMIAALFFVPSMIIILVTSGSLINALNPVVFVGLTFRIGWAYLLMYFFLFLLASAPAYLSQYIIRFLPTDLHLLVFGFAKSFYTIVSYHLMGYVILQYHEKIGYDVEYEDFRDPDSEDYESKKNDPDANVLKEVVPLIQSGKLDEAISVIQKMTEQQEIAGVNLAERFYNLLKMRKRNAELLAHGVKYLEILINNNQRDKAIAVFAECRNLDAAFLPPAAVLFKLAGWLNERGKTKASISIYNRLLQAYPDNPLVPKSYYRVAQIFHDRLMSTDKTKKILNLLKKKFPDHDIMPHVDNFLARL